MGIHIGSSGRSSSGQTDLVSQVAHGFSAGQVVRWNGAEWVLAQADSAANAGNGFRVGLVESPADDNFTLRTSGRMPLLAHGLTPHAEVFLSSTIAGGLVDEAPEAPAVVLPLATVVGDMVDVHIRNGQAT